MDGRVVIDDQDAIVSRLHGSVYDGVVSRRGWQFEGEDGPFGQAVAVCAEQSAHFAGGIGAAVEAKTVAVLAGGESVRENSGQVLGRDADAVVGDRDLDLVVSVHGNGDGNAAVRGAEFVDGVFGVADQVDQDLEDLVFVHQDGRHRRSHCRTIVNPGRSGRPDSCGWHRPSGRPEMTASTTPETLA